MTKGARLSIGRWSASMQSWQMRCLQQQAARQQRLKQQRQPLLQGWMGQRTAQLCPKARPQTPRLWLHCKCAAPFGCMRASSETEHT